MSIGWTELSVMGLGIAMVAGCTDYGVGEGILGGNRGATTLSGSGDTGEDGDDDDDDDDTGDDGDDDDDDDDCGDDDDDDDDGESDLPYDVRLEVGDTFVLTDAFEEEGPAPAEILSVTMDDGEWRLVELASLTPFTVDQTDCDHEGNRDEGRDRIEVRWRNADGSEDSDHLDLRYCGT